MPAISRQGDSVLSKYGAKANCASPMETTVDECNDKNVYVNGKLVPVMGNKITPHKNPGCATNDTSVITKASTTVFIGGKGVGRIGDEYTPDNLITQGSTNVFVG